MVGVDLRRVLRGLVEGPNEGGPAHANADGLDMCKRLLRRWSHTVAAQGLNENRLQESLQPVSHRVSDEQEKR